MESMSDQNPPVQRLPVWGTIRDAFATITNVWKPLLKAIALPTLAFVALYVAGQRNPEFVEGVFVDPATISTLQRSSLGLRSWQGSCGLIVRPRVEIINMRPLVESAILQSEAFQTRPCNPEHPLGVTTDFLLELARFKSVLDR